MALPAYPLKNKYYLLRHGESEANKKGIISGDPFKGTKDHGLTEEGKRQVLASLRRSSLGNNTLIISSDFLRAKQTARLAQKQLNAQPVKMTRLLRERNFGALNGKKDNAYVRVWSLDAEQPHHRKQGVESAVQVARRTARLLNRLERTYCGRTILLVSHGDTLQILSTILLGKSPAEHRTIRHISKGELRKIATARS